MVLLLKPQTEHFVHTNVQNCPKKNTEPNVPNNASNFKANS